MKKLTEKLKYLFKNILLYLSGRESRTLNDISATKIKEVQQL